MDGVRFSRKADTVSLTINLFGDAACWIEWLIWNKFFLEILVKMETLGGYMTGLFMLGSTSYLIEEY